MIHLFDRAKLQTLNFWLLTITGLLIVLNWHLINYDSVSLIFWIAALSITWRNRNNLFFESNLFSSSTCLLIVGWVELRCILSNNSTDLLARTYPLVSLLGICLLASKITKINQYWREITIVSLTSIPFEHIFIWLSPRESISILDAKLSRIILWYLGFNVHQIDNIVFLPTGSIEITNACSSFNLLWLMWQFSLVACLCFSMRKSQKILLCIWGTIIALVTNGTRLCLMALLVANNHTEAFDYWHNNSGAEIFTTIAILLFALVYWILTRPINKDLSNLYES